MLSHGMHTAKYGVQTTFYWFFEDATVVDAPFTGTAPVAADIFISKDGGAPAAATNGMTAIGNGIYSHVVTATEMQATRLSISVYDQTATEIFKPACMVVLTKLQLGQIDVDATQIGGNTPAAKFQGVGTNDGHGIHAIGGATNCYGMKLQGGSSQGGGLLAEAPADGPGIWGLGANTTSQEWGGIVAFGNNTGASGNCHGILASGAGTGAGIFSVGGNLVAHNTAASEGIVARGGTTASGHGINAIGGSTSGVGLRAVGSAGNSGGATITGQGSGHGVAITGGATGDGIKTLGGATSGHGLNAQAQASGDGFHGVGAGGGSAANFGGGGGASISWDDLEGTEPSGAPPSNASFRQILQYLKRCELNYATEGNGERIVYKDDDSTELYSQTINANSTTRTRGRAQ